MDHIVLEEFGGTKEEEESMKLTDIKELLKALNETGTTEFNYEGDGVRLVVRRGKVVAVEDEKGIDIPVEEKAAVEAPAETLDAEEPDAEADDIVIIEAPMVGTFYRSCS